MTGTARTTATDALRHCALFSRVDDATLDVCIDSLRTRHYRRNETIFHQGDPGDSLYIIESGAVKIVLPSPEGEDEAIIATLGAGDFFGELALLDGAERSATAIAHEATTALVLRRDAFGQLIDTVPALRHELLAGLVAELRRLTHHVEELHFLDLPGRLARRIVRLAREVDPDPSGPVTPELELLPVRACGHDRRDPPDGEPAPRGLHGGGPDPDRPRHAGRARPRPPRAGGRTLSRGGTTR